MCVYICPDEAMHIRYIDSDTESDTTDRPDALSIGYCRILVQEICQRVSGKSFQHNLFLNFQFFHVSQVLNFHKSIAAKLLPK